MSESEQINQFANELDKLIERFRAEYDLTYASVVGALTIKAHTLVIEAIKK